MSLLPPDWKRHRHAWERLDVGERRQIAAAIRKKSPPWNVTIDRFRTGDGAHDSGVRSLVYAMAVYGPDDPFVQGVKSLDDPDVIAVLRAVAEDAERRRAERAA